MSEEGRWELPEGWEWASADRFAKIVGGGTPANAKDSDNYASDGIPWITPADLSGYKATHISTGRRSLSKKGFLSSSARMIPKGSVLLSSRAPVGYCVVAANDISTNQGFKSFVLRNADVHPEFLRYYLVGSKRYLESEASGTTFLELSGGRAEQLVFPIAPTREQERIVSKIDELFSSIEEGERALERVRKLVERYRQSVLKAAVTGELTREWRKKHEGEMESGEALLTRILEARRKAWEKSELAKMSVKDSRPSDGGWKRKYKEPIQPDTTGLPGLPDRWVWTSLPTVCAMGATSGISVKGSNAPPGIPALRLDAMATSGFDYTAIRYIPISKETAHRLKIVEGDFFISRANGTLRLVGRAILANEPKELVVFPDTMIRYRLLRVPDLREWLSTIWSSQLLRSQIEKRAKTTAGIYKISQEDISTLAIPLPPLDEQVLICSLVKEKLAQTERVLSEILLTQKLASASKQAILQRAFAGQLVPQDPTDEPASVLLERIAAERSTSPKRVDAKPVRKKKVKA